MKTRIITAVFFVVSLALSTASQAQDTEAGWKAGAASVVVTPEQPLWMAGYGSRNKPSEGKLHDLFAKALALEDAGGTRLVIVTTDLVSIPRPLRDVVEKAVQERFSLPPASLLMNCSHTQSGPVLLVNRKRTIYPLDDEQAQRAEAYLRGLEAKLVALVGRALDGLEPAWLNYSHARAGFAMNRRLETEQGYLNRPNPEGPVDHDVPVLQVEGRDGKLRAVLFGYACHNTTLGFYKFCGDYAGYAQQYLEADHPGVTALFMIGCGGDQNPYPRHGDRGLEYCQQHGRTLATAVEAALETTPRPVRGPLAVALEEAALKFAPPPSREQLLRIQKSRNRYERRHADLLLEELEQNGAIRTTYPYPVQVVQFGNDLTMVALAGEVVVDYSLRLKLELPGPAVWIAGYSNDVFNYVPSLRVLQEGGYEAVRAISSGSLPGPFDPSVEKRIVDKVHELANRVRQEITTNTPTAAGK